jgi:hypothetical protein
MKKCLLFVSVVMASVTLFAQNNFAVGPVAGFGHSWISNVDGNARYKPSGNFGAQFYYSASEHIGIGTGLMYSIEGGENRISNSTYTARLNYLRLPIQAAYFFGEYGDRVRPKIAFGPSFGFLVGGKQSLNASESGVSDAYKSVDFGFQANGGIHLRLVSGVWLTMDIGYYTGVADITESDLKNKNRNIGFNAGLLFGAGTKY